MLITLKTMKKIKLIHTDGSVKELNIFSLVADYFELEDNEIVRVDSRYNYLPALVKLNENLIDNHLGQRGLPQLRRSETCKDILSESINFTEKPVENRMGVIHSDGYKGTISVCTFIKDLYSLSGEPLRIDNNYDKSVIDQNEWTINIWLELNGIPHIVKEKSDVIK